LKPAFEMFLKDICFCIHIHMDTVTDLLSTREIWVTFISIYNVVLLEIHNL